MDGNARCHRRDGFGAEHSYPTPTRRLMATAQREHDKRNPVTSGRVTVASKVRHGKIINGERVYFHNAPPTEHDLTVRQEELANLAEERRQRQERIKLMVYNASAEIDHW